MERSFLSSSSRNFYSNFLLGIHKNGFIIIFSLFHDLKSRKMLLHEFWLEYQQIRIRPSRWRNCTFCRGAFSTRNNNRFSLNLLFTFEAQLCKKVLNKLNALTRIAPYLSHKQRRLVYSSFFTRQLSHGPLIWTFWSRQSSHVINKLQE